MTEAEILLTAEGEMLVEVLVEMSARAVKVERVVQMLAKILFGDGGVCCVCVYIYTFLYFFIFT